LFLNLSCTGRNVVKPFSLAFLLAALAAPALAHDIITTNLTYSRDISRIFARRCISCHAAGSSIPFTSYEEVRPWAVDIKEQVLSRAMPPWGAVKGFGNLAPDAGLTQEELLIIAAWVVGGAPRGDNAVLPTPNSPPRLKLPPLVEAVTVSNQVTLEAALTLYAIEPVSATVVASSRITATLPDGRIEPLVWLYRYDPKQKHAFRFREPLELPAGTLIQATSPVTFRLETLGHNAATGMVKTTVFTTP
jgi:hypothetical protein